MSIKYVNENNENFKKECISACCYKGRWYCYRKYDSSNLNCNECKKFRDRTK